MEGKEEGEMTLDEIHIPDELLPAPEELPGDLALVAEVVGTRLTLELVRRLRGTAVYFRNVDPLLRRHRDRLIRQAYDAGERVPDIARRFKISTRWVWHILGQPDEDGARRQVVDERQLGLW